MSIEQVLRALVGTFRDEETETERYHYAKAIIEMSYLIGKKGYSVIGALDKIADDYEYYNFQKDRLCTLFHLV